ncbi:Hint domain-containing protein [Tropicibacter sp. R15_0]|uniref:Hint domain-containing protein n=1 Tax=Tropicibacter sp. R15_0 TaxID=2821101 RepID=UPI001ADAD244|nr:Hint domain-containing protein [Tropicibacter sp. R15_0]MBO9467963.1 Hint domain-containing protein [Tropicibacter sp. R15_0]
MPLFEFDDSGANNGPTSGANISVTEVDEGVTFSMSTAGNPGANQLTHSFSIGPGADGQFSMSDFGGGGIWTLDVVGGTVNTDFSAAGLSLQLGSSISGTWSVRFIGDNSNVTVAVTGSTQVITPVAGSNTHYTEIQFVSAGASGFMTVDYLNATLMCYCAGTQIATPEGTVAVEELKAGDMVLTADGRATEVTWLGLQPVETRLTHPAKVNPICISAGALAENVPSRDLFVSPDHAIEVDGVLYQASALVNGTSITMVEKMPRDGFTYYHVETAAHELLLAENTPAESFIEMGDLAEGFVNIAERGARVVTEMDLPRVSDRRLVPAALRAKLAERAETLKGISKAA